MKPLKCVIIGFPHSEIFGNPLETLYGIRVRDWALFTQLDGYGIDASLYVESSARVSPEIEAEYGAKLVRDEKKLIADCNSGVYDCVILSGTKIQELLRQVPFVAAITKPDFFGAFCYDNDPAEIDVSITARMIGVTFTSPLHKRHWEKRRTNVPSILITTGQTPKGATDFAGDGSVLFMGYVHTPQNLHKLAQMAESDPDRTYHVVSSFIRKLDTPGKEYDSLARMDDAQRAAYFQSYVERIAGNRPSNLQYHFLPPGQEEDLLNTVSVAIDFSWMANQVLENSKICHYLTYGIAPIAQMPAPSFRYVHRFGYGQVVPFNAPTSDWVEAIRKAAEACTLAERNRVRLEAGQVFNWKNVTFEVASFLIDHYRQRNLLK